MTKSPSLQNNTPRPAACVILAAGQGTRMRSNLPKVMHHVAGLPMIRHVLNTCQAIKPERVIVVVGPHMPTVEIAAASHPCVIQKKPQGTGDAVRAAKDALEGFKGDILVLYGDTPLISTDDLIRLQAKREETGAAVVVGGFTPSEAGAYGRLIVEADGGLAAIVEAKEATPEQLKIQTCNSGFMLLDADHAWELLDKVDNKNAKQEYYLTDCVHLARAAKLKCSMIDIPAENVHGINTRVELAQAEKIMQSRLRRKAMLECGVTLTDPETVFLSADTVFGKDIVIGPNVVIGCGVEIGDNVTIRAFTHIEETVIEAGAQIGPFARLRPGSVIGQGAHIGNFVEIKKSEIAPGAKVNHLTYIGDAFVGAKSNIGAGTITCNYDGYTKSHTHIGAGVFIGSNVALVAPVKVEDGAIVGAGSIITKDVPADALAVARAKQTTLEEGGRRFREMKEAKKKQP